MSSEFLKKAIQDIPSSEFLAHQALTVKVELTLRDYIHFNLLKNNHFSKKEVKGLTTMKSGRSSCDLAIFNTRDCLKNDVNQLIELKQYYTDDVIYSARSPKKIIEICVSDLDKYSDFKNVFSILFLVHFECNKPDFYAHGNQFTYFDSFARVREKNSYNSHQIFLDCENEMKKSLSKDFSNLSLLDYYTIELGSFSNIKVLSQVYVIRK